MTVRNPYESLEKIFHEPNRLAIVSALCGTEKGLAFNEVKDVCGLTDGNLNRHLKVLEDAGIVKIKKEFVGTKPRTTVFVSGRGLDKFNEYLGALSEVLEKARKALPAEKRRAAMTLSPKPVRA